MRKFILATALVALPFSVLHAAETFTIDPTHTYPHFKIDHLGFSTMQGRFNKSSGTLTLDKANKTGSVSIVIDATSVDTGMAKRDDHLRSPDFLNAAEFPEITYHSDKVVINADDTATVDGKLTIMGTSKAVRLQVSRIHCGLHPMDPKKKKYVCGFDATANIKRSDFGMNYALPAIGDDMALSFEVEAIRN